MSRKVNISDYNYLMFVDASGDDGYKFKETSSAGSSYSFVVSCFVCKSEDLAHNKQVLQNMKSAMLVRQDQEIKSTALKRHRLAHLVYEEMRALKGFCYSLIADKKLLQKDVPKGSIYDHLSQVAKNDLSGITHSFPYFTLSNSKQIHPGERVLIVIDNMKNREKESIREMLEKNAKQKDYTLIFRDSKDAEFSLIQIADIVSGAIRSYYEQNLPLKTHNYLCNSCYTTIKKSDGSKTRTFRSLYCQKKNNKKQFKPYISDTNFNMIARLHQCDACRVCVGEHIVILPIHHLTYYMYIECLIIGRILGTRKES